MFTRPLLLALSGVLLAAGLSLAVFFVSEAALGTDSSPLEPREPVFVATTTSEPELEPATTTQRTETDPLDLLPVATEDDEPVDDRGRNRGRGRGRSGGDSDGSDSDSSGSGSSGSSGSGSSGSDSSGSSGKGSDDD